MSMDDSHAHSHHLLEHMSSASMNHEFSHPWLMVFSALLTVFLLQAPLKHLYPNRLKFRDVRFRALLTKTFIINGLFCFITYAHWLAMQGILTNTLHLQVMILSFVLSFSTVFLTILLFVYGRHPLNTLLISSCLLLATLCVHTFPFLQPTFFQRYSSLSMFFSTPVFVIAFVAILVANYFLHRDAKFLRGLPSAVLIIFGAICVQHGLLLPYEGAEQLTSVFHHYLASVLIGLCLIGLLVSYSVSHIFSIHSRLFTINRDYVKNLHLLRSIPEALVSLNAAKKLNFINEEARQLLACDDKTDVNKIPLYFSENRFDQRISLGEFLKEVIEDEKNNTWSMVLKIKEGQQKHLKIRLKRTYDILFEQENMFPAYVFIFIDVSTNVKQVETAFKTAIQYRHLLANLPCVAFCEKGDGLGQMLYVSDSMKLMTGFPASHFTTEGSDYLFMDRIHPNDLAEYLETKEAAATGLNTYECQYRFLNCQEEEIWLKEMGVCYRNDDGQVLVNGVCFDVSAEQERKQTVETQMAIAQKTSQIQWHYFSDISTSLRTPLNSVIGLSQSLLKNTANLSSKRELEMIHEAGEQLLDFVNVFTEDAKLENDTLVLSDAPFSLPQLCHQLAFEMQRNTTSSDFSFSYFYDDALNEEYIGDAKRIKTLLQRIIWKISSGLDQGRVCLHLIAHEAKVRFVISFDCQQTDVLPETFELPSLMITQWVELMKGNWWCDQVNDYKGLIYLDLPLPSEKTLEVKNTIQFGKSAYQGQRLLVIDDVQRQANELNELALRLGFSVSVFQDMSLTRQRILEEQIDCVLIDVYLNDDQFPSMAMIKQWAQEKNVRLPYFIALSMATDEALSEEWRLQGYDAVLAKPFDMKALLDVLHFLYPQLSHVNDRTLSPLDDTTSALIFDEAYVLKVWRHLPYYFEVLTQFYRQCHALRASISRQEQTQPLLVYIADNAPYLGLNALAQVGEKLYGNTASLSDEMLDQLFFTLSEGMNQAGTFLGVRQSAFEDLPPDKSLKDILSVAERFRQNVQSGRLENELYDAVISAFAPFASVKDLHEFIVNCDSFSFDIAEQQLMALCHALPSESGDKEKRFGL